MQRLRMLRRLVRMLVALFLVAQFAGVVSSPLASSEAFANAVASHAQHQHMHHQGGAGAAHHHDDQGRHHADYCCALHAFFAGVLPAAIAVETIDAAGRPIFSGVGDIGFGVAPGRLDRPPRPFAPI
jgi:hypothetical protein